MRNTNMTTFQLGLMRDHTEINGHHLHIQGDTELRNISF